MGETVLKKIRGTEKGNAHPREPWRHDYLVVSGDVLSFGPEEDGNLLGAPGRQIPGERSDRACVSVCSDDKFDKYIYEALNIVGYPRYCLVAFKGTPQHRRGERNCQSWVDDILDRAISLYLEREDCPECFK